MKKKLLFLFSVVVLCCVMLALNVSAAAWDGTVADDFAGGTGTKADPYQISTAEQLAYLAQSVNHGNTYEGEYIKLTADIVLNNTTSENWAETARTWTPIGNSSTYVFSGTFDGNGYTIRGLYISSQSKYQGLFGRIYNAMLKNVTIINADITGTDYVGALVGYAEYYAKKVTADFSLRKCTVKNASIMGKDYIGGIAGYVYAHADGSYTTPVELFFTIDRCSGRNNTIISEQRAGGIIGHIGSSYASYGTSNIEFTSCTNSGTVSAMLLGPYDTSTYIYAGGIVGYCNTSATFKECMNSSAVSALHTNAGGIVGYCAYSSVFKNCCNAGTSMGSGIVDYLYAGEITNCCSGGVVSGKAIISSIGSGTVSISNCCYLSGSAQTDTHATAFTEEQMKQQSNFVGFDFTNVWVMGDTDYPYPVLRGTEDIKKTDAQTPTIFVQTNSVNCAEGEIPTLFACSSVTDGGTLTYQWYVCDTEEGEYTAIADAIHAAYQPTQTSGTKYYVVTVTNTNNYATGVKSVTVRSNVTAVTIEEPEEEGYTLTGALITSGDAADVIIELLADGEIIRTVTVQNTTGTTAYTIDSVPSGTYTIRVSKENHVSREYTVAVGTPE